MGEVSAYLNAEQKELADVALTPEGLAGMIKLIEKEPFLLRSRRKCLRN